MFRIMKRRLFAGLGVLGVLAAVAGAAFAGIPDPGGQIHSCYKTIDARKAGGTTLSVIDSQTGGSCRPGYTELTFNSSDPGASKASKEIRVSPERRVTRVSRVRPVPPEYLVIRSQWTRSTFPPVVRAPVMLTAPRARR